MQLSGNLVISVTHNISIIECQVITLYQDIFPACRAVLSLLTRDTWVSFRAGLSVENGPVFSEAGEEGEDPAGKQYFQWKTRWMWADTVEDAPPPTWLRRVIVKETLAACDRRGHSWWLPEPQCHFSVFLLQPGGRAPRIIPSLVLEGEAWHGLKYLVEGSCPWGADSPLPAHSYAQ